MDNIKNLVSNKYKNVVKGVERMPDYYNYAIVFISLILIWFFTYFRFQFAMSVLFAIITMLSLSKINIVVAVVFALIYAYLIFNLFQMKRRIEGDVLAPTDMIKKGKPFVASLEKAEVASKDIPQGSGTTDFTYSFWIYINSVNILPNNKDYQNTWMNYRYGDWKSVFYRGLNMKPVEGESEEEESNKDVSLKEQFPGVWLAPTKNQMSIVFQNGEDNQKAERVDIDDLPLNQWFQVIIVVEGNSVSIFINGKLENIIILNQFVPTSMNERSIFLCNDSFLNFAPKKDSDSIFTCPDNCSDDDGGDSSNKLSGFPGFLGEMIYFPYALDNNEIEKNYEYYKPIIESYQKFVLKDVDNKIPRLITNSSKASTTFESPDFDKIIQEMKSKKQDSN